MLGRPTRQARGGGAYLPPHLRKGGSSSSQHARSLENLAPYNVQIRVEYTADGPFSFDGCPDNMADAITQQQQLHQQKQVIVSFNVADGINASSAQGTESGQVACCYLDSPACPDTYQIEELLGWFLQASGVKKEPDFPHGDTRAVLSLPASLAKQERAMWHRLAEGMSLHSQSTGIGDKRFLQIRPSMYTPSVATIHGAADSTGSADIAHVAAADSAGTAFVCRVEAGTEGAQGGHGAKSRVKQVWEWCQAEGGAFWNYSQGEVAELLSRGGSMPQELTALLRKREASLQLVAALQAGDKGTALQLLASAPQGVKLGWIRDQESRGYPAHIAAWHGLSEVMQQLVAMHGRYNNKWVCA
eukprot:GHRR01010605.1.p1 GENE.GHRR01010605.1~~GHRR01010605.1.p1  ORF type:complete len:359 (+),score=105.94 GHRR01010605.1:397-1473(+)